MGVPKKILWHEDFWEFFRDIPAEILKELLLDPDTEQQIIPSSLFNALVEYALVCRTDIFERIAVATKNDIVLRFAWVIKFKSKFFTKEKLDQRRKLVAKLCTMTLYNDLCLEWVAKERRDTLIDFLASKN